MNELVKQFDAMAQMMTAMAGKGMRERMKMVRELQSGMMNNPNGLAAAKSRHRQAAHAEGTGQAQEAAQKELRSASASKNAVPAARAAFQLTWPISVRRVAAKRGN